MKFKALKGDEAGSSAHITDGDCSWDAKKARCTRETLFIPMGNGYMNLGTSCRAINKDIVMDDEPKSLVNQKDDQKVIWLQIFIPIFQMYPKHFVNINLK